MGEKPSQERHRLGGVQELISNRGESHKGQEGGGESHRPPILKRAGHRDQGGGA